MAYGKYVFIHSPKDPKGDPLSGRLVFADSISEANKKRKEYILDGRKVSRIAKNRFGLG